MEKNPNMLAPNILAPKWMEQLGFELFELQLHGTFAKVKHTNYLPLKHDIFKAFQVGDFDTVKVVIVGQDPYHSGGLANGLAFATNIGSAIALPPSLRNIFKEVERSIGCAIDETKTDLGGWANQGVMLLNMILTVSPGKPLSHIDFGWQTLTKAAIVALSNRDKPTVFMLWGSVAQEVESLIDPKHLVLKATHPNPRSANSGPYAQRFVGCNHFSKANTWLIEKGEESIRWREL